MRATCRAAGSAAVTTITKWSIASDRFATGKNPTSPGDEGAARQPVEGPALTKKWPLVASNYA